MAEENSFDIILPKKKKKKKKKKFRGEHHHLRSTAILALALHHQHNKILNTVQVETQKKKWLNNDKNQYCVNS